MYIDEKILNLKEQISKEQKAIDKYKNYLKDLDNYIVFKKKLNISCFICSLFISIIFGFKISFEWFIISFITLILMQNSIFIACLESNKEIKEKQKNIKEWREEARNKISELEKKIYFLENPIKKEEINNLEIVNEYKIQEKNKTKELIKNKL